MLKIKKKKIFLAAGFGTWAVYLRWGCYWTWPQFSDLPSYCDFMWLSDLSGSSPEHQYSSDLTDWSLIYNKTAPVVTLCGSWFDHTLLLVLVCDPCLRAGQLLCSKYALLIYNNAFGVSTKYRWMPITFSLWRTNALVSIQTHTAVPLNIMICMGKGTHIFCSVQTCAN